jgi:hypothetical protein
MLQEDQMLRTEIIKMPVLREITGYRKTRPELKQIISRLDANKSTERIKIKGWNILNAA